MMVVGFQLGQKHLRVGPGLYLEIRIILLMNTSYISQLCKIYECEVHKNIFN